MRLGGFADVERDFVLKRHDDRECERSLRTRRVKPDKMVYLECRTKRFHDGQKWYIKQQQQLQSKRQFKQYM